MAEREMRFGRVESRAAADAPRKIGGYAATFNNPAMIGPYFEETLAPGCFTDTLGRQDDVVSLFNHDDNLLLGRTRNGTLTLKQDDKGLIFEVEPPDTACGNDVVKLVQRGDLDQCSFAFIATKEEWDETGEVIRRTVLQANLFDTSIVTTPAYTNTSAAVRSSKAVFEAHQRSVGAANAGDDADRALHLWQARKRRFELGLL